MYYMYVVRHAVRHTVRSMTMSAMTLGCGDTVERRGDIMWYRTEYLGELCQGCARAGSVELFAVHPLAIIDDPYRTAIGERTRLWHGARVMGMTSVGARCNIGSDALVKAGAELGDDVFVGHGVTIPGWLSVGNAVRIETDVSFVSRKPCSYPCHVGDGAVIRSGSKILNVSIGARSIVHRARVSEHVNPETIVERRRARPRPVLESDRKEVTHATHALRGIVPLLGKAGGAAIVEHALGISSDRYEPGNLRHHLKELLEGAR